MPRRKDLQLSREAVADVALELFREGGVKALTTRRVAAELGASPMSLYVHVGNKDGLLDAVVERAVDSIQIDLDPDASWTAQAEQWAHSLRQQLQAHEGIMDLLASRRWAIVRCTEPLVRALLAAGFSEERAVRAARLLTWSTIGFLSVETGVELLGDASDDEERSVRGSLSRLEQLEGRAASAPASRAHGVDRADIDALFAMQLRMIVRGIENGLDAE